MLHRLPRRIATYGLTLILGLVVLFHICVLTGLIPFSIVWGGRLENQEQMIVFEAISIFLNVCMLAIVFISIRHRNTLIVIALWLMAVLFFINTIGNLLSTNELERILFTPLTLVLTIFSVRLAFSPH